jgi:hypothetical protein
MICETALLSIIIGKIALFEYHYWPNSAFLISSLAKQHFLSIIIGKTAYFKP